MPEHEFVSCKKVNANTVQQYRKCNGLHENRMLFATLAAERAIQIIRSFETVDDLDDTFFIVQCTKMISLNSEKSDVI